MAHPFPTLSLINRAVITLGPIVRDVEYVVVVRVHLLWEAGMARTALRWHHRLLLLGIRYFLVPIATAGQQRCGDGKGEKHAHRRIQPVFLFLFRISQHIYALLCLVWDRYIEMRTKKKGMDENLLL
jgi:hypothetical protein